MLWWPRINIISANEHVREIERRIVVVKKKARSARHRLPFNKIPKLFTIYIFFTVVRMINYFPVKGGVSDILSPNTIISGETQHYK